MSPWAVLSVGYNQQTFLLNLQKADIHEFIGKFIPRINVFIYKYKVVSFNKIFFCIFLVISVSVQGLWPGLKPVKCGCVVHCVTSKNNQKSQKGEFYKWRKQGLLT